MHKAQGPRANGHTPRSTWARAKGQEDQGPMANGQGAHAMGPRANARWPKAKGQCPLAKGQQGHIWQMLQTCAHTFLVHYLNGRHYQ